MDVKFRAWDSIENGWVDEDWIRQNAGAWLLGEIPKEITLQQYTGFTDKNGKEIYDGDLIKGDGYGPYRVFWDEKIGGWCSCCYSDAELISRYSSIEVVGHIFDGTEYEGVR